MKPTVPNLLTFLRILLIPVFVVVFFLPFAWAPPITCAIFAMAGFTDWLDGYIARKFNAGSRFGAFLDPVADKLMVTTALVLLLANDPSAWLAIAVIIIISREITISALREWMAELGISKHVAVSFVAKLKTTVQMLGIGLMLFQYPLGPVPIYDMGVWTLFVSAGLTLWSMCLYLLAAWPYLRQER